MSSSKFGGNTSRAGGLISREALISGLFSIVAAVAAAFVPILWPSILSSSDGVLLVRQLDTRVSQSLIIEEYKNLNLTQHAKRITVVSLENVGDDEIQNFKVEIRASVPWVDLSFGSRVSGKFFSSDQTLEPSGDNSIIASYQRFPRESRQDIFILSDEDFLIESIIPNRNDVKIAYADKYLWKNISKESFRSSLAGALWFLAFLAAVWTILRLLKIRTTLQIQKVR